MTKIGCSPIKGTPLPASHATSTPTEMESAIFQLTKPDKLGN
ncbi:hypothetical protein CGSHiHH_08372 [Haemophilus influenzae PittHH]|nr:hypothetical protein CGSHiHH_08372 [Haemophilus influenzae PittHH]